MPPLPRGRNHSFFCLPKRGAEQPCSVYLWLIKGEGDTRPHPLHFSLFTPTPGQTTGKCDGNRGRTHPHFLLSPPHRAKPPANEMGTAAAPIPLSLFTPTLGQTTGKRDGNRGRTHSHFSLFTPTPGQTTGK